MASLMIISFLILGLTKTGFGVAAILLQQAARGLYRPVTTKYLNKHIPSDKRATILSFHSLLTNLAIALTFPFMGMLKDRTSIFSTHIILAFVMLGMVFLVTLYMNSRIGVNRERDSSESV
jgi:predicted MFS family arabinose efflux permease